MKPPLARSRLVDRRRLEDEVVPHPAASGARRHVHQQGGLRADATFAGNLSGLATESMSAKIYLPSGLLPLSVRFLEGDLDRRSQRAADLDENEVAGRERKTLALSNAPAILRFARCDRCETRTILEHVDRGVERYRHLIKPGMRDAEKCDVAAVAVLSRSPFRRQEEMDRLRGLERQLDRSIDA
ncbi:MAG: hypothetical protein ACLP1D_04715 [Xanthobacteraceae bacterium]